MRVEYFAWDESRWQDLQAHLGLRRLFNLLVVQQGGDVEAALRMLRALQAQGWLDSALDLDRFAAELEAQEVVREAGGTRELTARGERALRRDAFAALWGHLRRRGSGQHAVPREGAGGDALPETQPFDFGDDLDRIDFKASLKNALRRSEGQNLELRESDLEVHESEMRTSCATVLLLDISHSMILYGEDRITPAKRVALALTELILTQFPKDSLDLVLFGDEAKRVQIADLPYVQVGPYHTNTRAALQMGRRLLARRKHANKQVILITDGKPSCIWEDGALYKHSFGLDPRITNRTLDEAIALRRQGIPITTFMVARDPLLQRFIERLTELNHGRAYFASLRDLDQYVLVDFMRHRRRNVR